MDQFRIYKLIWYKMTGTLTAAQNAELERWIAQSDRRAQWLTNLQDENNIRKDINLNSCFNQQQGWENIERRITPQISAKRRMHQVAGIAAIALLVLTIGTVLFMWSPKEKNAELATAETIMPGEFNALLTIDDAEMIILQDTVNTSIDRGHQKMAEVKNGALAYLADTSLEPVSMKIEVPERSEFHFVLSDGSELWMNAGSKAIFQQPFANDKRSVYMEGEVFYKVAKDKNRPFIVDICGTNSQEVLGTSFNVKAYPEDDYQQSVLIEGSVLWRTSDGLERIMEPGELLHYEAATDKIEMRNVDVYPYIAWKEGRFVFDGVSLNTIMQALGRWYGVSVVYADPQIKDLHFSIDVQKYEDLGTILHMLELTGKVQFEVNELEVLINKNL